jgi:uncharacterized protein (TIGR03435 family)
MLQTLLADRFRLRVRNDTREGIVYRVVMARADRRLGPGLKPVTQPCARTPRDAKANRSAVCTELLGRRAIEINAQSLPHLVSRFAVIIGAPVIDQTGLSGFYDVNVKWTPTETTNDSPPDYVPLFIAIEEQLGLKLERGRGPIEVLVIDSVERPTPD